jgi:hypothetical protein
MNRSENFQAPLSLQWLALRFSRMTTMEAGSL